MSDICYRVCDRCGWSKFNTLAALDAYLTKKMAEGFAPWPIKRIVRVTSEDVPLTETARRYNDMANAKEQGGGDNGSK